MKAVSSRAPVRGHLVTKIGNDAILEFQVVPP